MTTIQDILALENRRYAAMVAGDLAVLDELLADDLVYTHSSAEVDTKASYIDGLRTKKWNYKGVERPVEEITLFGDVARVVGHARLTLCNPAGAASPTRTVNGRFLNMWAKRDGVWRLVAWQSTPIPVPPA